MIRKAFAALIAWLCRHDGEAVYAEPTPPVVYCTTVKVIPVDPDGSRLLMLSDGKGLYVARLCEHQAPLVSLDLWPARARAFSKN